ncbi:MAG: DegT/DnrJ/EryC1/StrS family aminotransferase [Lachnospiraceae bacterium]|nr:DegT/DnrJ/EryC1/StrS family aminotransferase [Lachnospiraceae bacterium]
MEFRDLRRQYKFNKERIDKAIADVLYSTQFIHGSQVEGLEEELANYVGVRHCVTCANGTDALQLALMVWNIGEGDAVFVPDFTFFSCAEVVAAVGAVPIFIDVDEDTFNMDAKELLRSIEATLKDGHYTPKAIVSVDLFGQPADYAEIRKIADQFGLFILEDAAQGFGGAIGSRKSCAFGDISTTSFFPAKPLGCYGDGGAVFTDHDDWALLLRSLTVHGKGKHKYDNARIGMNSRLDTVQAAILLAKLPVFIQRELDECDKLAKFYTKQLDSVVKVPYVKEGFCSSWAQYTVQLKAGQDREKLQKHLKTLEIPTAVYYPKPLHRQKAFLGNNYAEDECPVTNRICERVLSLPFHPYMRQEEAEMVVEAIRDYLGD